jgi:hypothetical protein
VTGKFKSLFTRIPWRLLAAALGGALVASGGARLLSVELPGDLEQVARVVKQGIAMVVVGGVVLIAVIVSR